MKPDEFLRIGDYRINPAAVAYVTFDRDDDGSVDELVVLLTDQGVPDYFEFKIGTPESNALRTYFGYPDPDQ